MKSLTFGKSRLCNLRSRLCTNFLFWKCPKKYFWYFFLDRSDALQLHVRPDRRPGVPVDQYFWSDDLVYPGPNVPCRCRRPTAWHDSQAETGPGLICSPKDFLYNRKPWILLLQWLLEETVLSTQSIVHRKKKKVILTSGKLCLQFNPVRLTRLREWPRLTLHADLNFMLTLIDCIRVFVWHK